MNASRLALALALLLPAACKKEGANSGNASGALDDSERAVLAHLPAGAKVVFGGNYNKFLEYWDSSPLKRLAESSMSSLGPSGMRDYMDCWMGDASTDVLMAGSLEVEGGVAMNMVFVGLSIDKLERCSKKGNFTVERSADGKWVTLGGIPDGLGGTTTVGYYFLDPKTAFFSLDMNLGGLGLPSNTPSRADIEGKIARAKSKPAIDDPQIKTLIERVDRSKSFWISGTAAGTPFADKIGSGHGWLDVEKDAISAGFSIELDSAETASEVVSKYNEAKSQISQAPPQFRDALEDVFKGIKLSAKGKLLSGSVRITNAMIDKLAPLMQMFGGGL